MTPIMMARLLQAAVLAGVAWPIAASDPTATPAIGLAIEYREIATFDSFFVKIGRADPWSPRGSRLLMHGTYEGRYGCYVVDFDDPELRLQHIGRSMPNSIWSPDGRWILSELEPPNHWKSDEYIVVAALSVDGERRVELDVPDKTFDWSWANDGVFRYADVRGGALRAVPLAERLGLHDVRPLGDSPPGLLTVFPIAAAAMVARRIDGSSPIDSLYRGPHSSAVVARDRTPTSRYLVTDHSESAIICDAYGRILERVTTSAPSGDEPTNYFPETMLPNGYLLGTKWHYGGGHEAKRIGMVVASANFARRGFVPLPTRVLGEPHASPVRPLVAWTDESSVVHVGELRVTPK